MKQKLTALVKKIQHPYILALACLLAVFTITDFIATPPKIPGSDLILIPFFALLVYFAINPAIGSYLVVIFVILSYASPIFSTSIFELFAMFVATAYIAYIHPLHAVVLDVIVTAIMTVLGIIQPDNYYDFANVVGINLFGVVFTCVGAVIRINEHKKVTNVQNENLQHNITVARKLHDYATNDLSSIMVLVSHLQQSNPHMAKTLEPIYSMAEDALLQTRQAILSLEQPTNEKQIVSTKEWQSFEPELTQTIDKQRMQLTTLEFQGDIIQSGQAETLDASTQTMILDFLRELFCNIAKHADPKGGYIVLLAFTNAACVIGCSDKPLSSEQDKPGLESGLAYYKTQIEADGGSFETTRTDERWNLYTSINLQPTHQLEAEK